MDNIRGIMDRFINARSNSIEQINKLKGKGTKLVGTYCTFSPVEIILASGAKPIRLCNINESYLIEGEIYLPRNLCQIVKSSYGEAVSGASPYFESVDLIIGETTCDGKKKMFEYLNDIKPTFIMQLPQRSQGEKEYILWKSEIERLKETLEKQFDTKITDNMIRNSIKTKNEERMLLKELHKSWIDNPTLLSALDIYTVLHNFNHRMDNRLALEDVSELIKAIKKVPALNIKQNNNTPKILVTGCHLGEKTEGIVNIIEEVGGDVIYIDTCDWVKDSEDLVREDIDPFEALAKKYLKIACPVMTPNYYRFDLISKVIDDYEIDGVINLFYQACLTFSVESVPLKKYVTKEKNIAYMDIETNLTQSDIGRLRTRIEAFIEMM